MRIRVAVNRKILKFKQEEYAKKNLLKPCSLFMECKKPKDRDENYYFGCKRFNVDNDIRIVSMFNALEESREQI